MNEYLKAKIQQSQFLSKKYNTPSHTILSPHLEKISKLLENYGDEFEKLKDDIKQDKDKSFANHILKVKEDKETGNIHILTTPHKTDKENFQFYLIYNPNSNKLQAEIINKNSDQVQQTKKSELISELDSNDVKILNNELLKIKNIKNSISYAKNNSLNSNMTALTALTGSEDKPEQYLRKFSIGQKNFYVSRQTANNLINLFTYDKETKKFGFTLIRNAGSDNYKAMNYSWKIGATRLSGKGNPCDENFHYVQTTKLDLEVLKRIEEADDLLPSPESEKDRDLLVYSPGDLILTKNTDDDSCKKPYTLLNEKNRLGDLYEKPADYKLKDSTWQEAFNRSKDFYTAYRTLNDYKSSFGTEIDNMLKELSEKYPNEDIFKSSVEAPVHKEKDLETVKKLMLYLVNNLFTEKDIGSGIIPDFNKKPEKITSLKNGDIYEEYQVKSKSGDKLTWVMGNNNGGNIWIENIYPTDSEIGLSGVRNQFINAGLLINKTQDYSHQVKSIPAFLTFYTELSTHHDYKDTSNFMKETLPLKMYQKAIDKENNKVRESLAFTGGGINLPK